MHMDSMQWLARLELVKRLGKEGKCRVEETPKGWFIFLAQNNPMEAFLDKQRLQCSCAEKEVACTLECRSICRRARAQTCIGQLCMRIGTPEHAAMHRYMRERAATRARARAHTHTHTHTHTHQCKATQRSVLGHTDAVASASCPRKVSISTWT